MTISRQQVRLNLLSAVRSVSGALISLGYASIKRRDGREPDQEAKERAEDRMAATWRRIFRKQRERVLASLESEYPERKSLKVDLSFADLDLEDEDREGLIKQIADMLRGGISLFGSRAKPAIDYTLTNAQAAEKAREYVFNLVRGINDTTRDVLRSAVSSFVQTPGMTIGDLSSLISPHFGADRADKIAITEVTRAYASGEVMAGEMMQREFPGVRVIKIWFTNNDQIVCKAICEPLDGQEAEIDGVFEGGYDQPPAHVGCILPGNEVVIPDLIAAAESFYVGRSIEITLANGRKITVTENHPILTPRGWVAAQFINEMDYLMVAVDPERIAATIDPYNNHAPTAIEQKFRALKMSNGVLSERVKHTPEDFHGDGRSLDGDIDVVYPNGFLLGNGEASKITKHFSEFCFNRDNMPSAFLAGDSTLNPFFLSSNPSFSGPMGFRDLGNALFRRHSVPLYSFGFRLSSDSNTGFYQPLVKGPTIDPGLASEFVFRFARLIASNQIVKVRDFSYSGHVYDLQSSMYQLYTCNSVIVKNCRCWIETTTALAELD